MTYEKLNLTEAKRRQIQLFAEADVYLELLKIFKAKAGECIEKLDFNGADAYMDIYGVLLTKADAVAVELEALKEELIQEMEES